MAIGPKTARYINTEAVLQLFNIANFVLYNRPKCSQMNTERLSFIH